jgi:hypothetical protein
MKESNPTDAAREQAAKIITAKRDALVTERATLLRQRLELLARLRTVDRELADCRAAARLFHLDIEFPPDDRDEELRLARIAHEERIRSAIEANETRILHARRAAVLNVQAPPIPVPTAERPEPPKPSRPTIREIALEQLKSAGEAGIKAAPLRDYIERTYGEIIHEKTVGMTLYRLSKEIPPHVRRSGHTWFFIPSSTEKKNPGGEAPGSESMFD